jgi:outer membrane protein assembly factor BamB
MTAARSGWRTSNALFLIVALLLPPLAILLLIARPEPLRAKMLGAVVLAALSGLYVNTALKLRPPEAPVGHAAAADPADWDALESHRAEQATAAEVDQEPATSDRRAIRSRYWTGFRGPGTAGRYDEVPVSTDWPAEGPALLWKQPIGEGWSSFAVADGVAFTLEKRRKQELVAAYDVESGRELWTLAWPSRFAELADRDGPRATPVWDEGRVYALGAAGDLVVVDAANGTELWRRDILKESRASNLTWGVAASPLVVGDLVVTMPGGPDDHCVVAYDKITGEKRWHALSDQASYASPVSVTLAGRPAVLVVTATRVVGLDPASGALLWERGWATDMGINVAQPVVLDDHRFMVSAGYGHGAMLVEVERDGDGLAARKVWETTRLKNKLSSSIVHDGHFYGLDEGILVCLDAETGDMRWKSGRYGHGQLLLAEGKLIVLTERGELALVEATPSEFVEHVKFPALEGRTWNSPALAAGILLIRNGREMAAYRLAEPGASA